MFLDQKKGFLGYDALYQTKPKIVVVPFGLEKTVSYGKGTKNGPQEIIKASHQVELFDEELNKEPYREIGIQTLKPFKIKNKIIDALNQIAEINNNIIESKKIPIILGGEHSITPGSIKPFSKKLKRLTLVHFDAHADLRDEYDGTEFNHACAVYEASKTTNLIQVGIRSMDISEKEVMNYDKVFFAEDIFYDESWQDQATEILSDNVFITLDVDVFDPSIMPSTGTPEPGGLLWNETISFLKKVFSEKNVVGFDIVELCPNENNKAPDFLASKLYYKMLSYKFLK